MTISGKLLKSPLTGKLLRSPVSGLLLRAPELARIQLAGVALTAKGIEAQYPEIPEFDQVAPRLDFPGYGIGYEWAGPGGYPTVGVYVYTVPDNDAGEPVGKMIFSYQHSAWTPAFPYIGPQPFVSAEYAPPCDRFGSKSLAGGSTSDLYVYPDTTIYPAYSLSQATFILTRA